MGLYFGAGTRARPNFLPPHPFSPLGQIIRHARSFLSGTGGSDVPAVHAGRTATANHEIGIVSRAVVEGIDLLAEPEDE